MFYSCFIDDKGGVIYDDRKNEIIFDVNVGEFESRVTKEGGREWANFKCLHSIGFSSRRKKVKKWAKK